MGSNTASPKWGGAGPRAKALSKSISLTLYGQFANIHLYQNGMVR
jgi:hypothetical protein